MGTSESKNTLAKGDRYTGGVAHQPPAHILHAELGLQLLRIMVPITPYNRATTIRVVCVSDTHLLHDQLILPEGDILIHSGDIMVAGEDKSEIDPFIEWINVQPFKHKIVIAGNHDRMLDVEEFQKRLDKVDAAKEKKRLSRVCTYLEDSAALIEGYRFYGSPWTPAAKGWAFFRERGVPLREVWKRMSEFHELNPIDVLITHGPPSGVGDGAKIGDYELLDAMAYLEPPVSHHVFGHAHSGFGMWASTRNGIPWTTFINAANCDQQTRINTTRHSTFDLPRKY